MSNLRQVTLSYKMAIDADEGKFWREGFSPTGVPPEKFAQSAQGQWRVEKWGLAKEGWICPAAPEKRTNAWAINALSIPPDIYSGSVDSAWIAKPSSHEWWWWWSENPATRKFNRADSYSPNNWINGEGWWAYNYYPKEAFMNETQIRDSSRTPMFADGIGGWWWGGAFWYAPRATDLPAGDLTTGLNPGFYGMGMFTIPRHGSRPRTLPTNFDAKNKLPGAINVSFYDGHEETVKLERLWSLYWHKDYVPPAKRPGL